MIRKNLPLFIGIVLTALIAAACLDCSRSYFKI